jgi:DNA repair photolyase
VPLHLTTAEVRSILTRAGGYLRAVCSHSLQPYRGCTFGNALCGQGCYVRHNAWLLRGERWGSFLEARTNAAAVYRQQYERERRWGRTARGRFAVFLSSSTDPFVPQEDRFGVTRSLFAAMQELPPDELIVQTHSDRVAAFGRELLALSSVCDLRVHVSVEGDQDRLPGLPPPAASVGSRLQAAAALKALGLRVVITCAPLHPILDPDAFFARVAAAADAVVLDHFVGGDGTPDGRRTRATALPAAMAAVVAASPEPGYLDRMVEVAARHLPGRVAVGPAGFAGRYGR